MTFYFRVGGQRHCECMGCTYPDEPMLLVGHAAPCPHISLWRDISLSLSLSVYESDRRIERDGAQSIGYSGERT